MNDDEERRSSDLPLDLAKERESFVRSFLKKGVEYTELLLGENAGLREKLEALDEENARLRAQVASDDAIRDLLRTVERLESERESLLERSSLLERVEREHAGRQAAIEQEINDLANLYIANFQLHASFSPRRVVRHLCDLMGQLVGALGFVIYVIDDDAKLAVPIAHEGLRDEDVNAVELGAGPVGEACLTGIRIVRESELGVGSHEDPIAIVPLMADGRPIGIIEIVTVLDHKTEWASVDHELFELVSQQAGAALIAAHHYDPGDGPLKSLAGFAEKVLKMSVDR